MDQMLLPFLNPKSNSNPITLFLPLKLLEMKLFETEMNCQKIVHPALFIIFLCLYNSNSLAKKIFKETKEGMTSILP